MRFMMMVRANKDSEAGAMPDNSLIAAMTKYNEEMAKAGILVDLAGLHPSSKGARIKFANGMPSVIDGPFAETKELIAGYWLIKVNSKEEAIDWARRCPAPFGAQKESEIELRQVFELEDFDQCPAHRGRAKARERVGEKEIGGRESPQPKGERNAIEPLSQLQRPMRGGVQVL